VAELSGNPRGPPHAHAWRTRTLRMPAKTSLAGDKIDVPAACVVPFRPYCGGVVTRTRIVSEYMLVLALCLVYLFVSFLANKRGHNQLSTSVRTATDFDLGYLKKLG